MKPILLLLTVILFGILSGNAQDVTIQVNVNQGRMPVSPYIYGRNNNFSNVFGTPTKADSIRRYKEAGLRFARENTGNNATKYNWRKKLSSHPDWYNNVYDHDWDYASQVILDNTPYMQVMWAFQLIGKVASNKKNNFNDWSYNNSQWWNGCSQNLAGGGQVNKSGGDKALVEGDTDLYLEGWNADSTTAILDHWFGKDGLDFPDENFIYWSMDNEPEIWSGTHDDVMPKQLPGADFMNLYFDVAQKAKEKFPGIKLTGPVPANEWQWYNYADETFKINGKYYSWLEYFIKRCADREKETGIRVLDVVDIHWYPEETKSSDVVNLHRVFYDKTYNYPSANGSKKLTGGWDNSLTKEYIFQRINDWLIKYYGENHGITLALTETEIKTKDVNVLSVAYASMLGTFANNGVEIFTPWTWKTGMWETLHLFSRYSQEIKVNTTSSLDNTVSGYTTVNSTSDSMTIILVNRDLSASRNVTVNLDSFIVADGNYSALELSSLPSTETFKSHTNNALKNKSVSVSNNSFTISLPSVSTTAVILTGKTLTGVNKISLGNSGTGSMILFPNPARNDFSIRIQNKKYASSTVEISDRTGRNIDSFNWEDSGTSVLNIDTKKYQAGLYFVTVKNDEFIQTKKIIITQ